MELRGYGQTLWKWLWLIVLGAVVAGGVTWLVSSRSTPIYRASTQLMVQQASNPYLPQWEEVLVSERLAANYAHLLTTRPVLEQAAADLNLPRITSKISVSPVRSTQIIVLSAEDPDPKLAAAVANALSGAFIRQSESQQRQRIINTLDVYQTQIEGLQANIDQAQSQLQALHTQGTGGAALTVEQAAEQARWESNLELYRSSQAELLRNRDELQRAEAIRGANVLVVEPAIETRQPVRPRVMMNTLIAAALGALLMTATAFLIEYLDDTITLSEDASRMTGLPALGLLVLERTREHEWPLPTVASPKSLATEAYRTLRTNLQFSSLDRPIDTLLITSANPAEGKSTVAANLAVIIAQGGARTILVDTDLRRPALHQIFGLPNALGVTNALLYPEGADLTPLLQSTAVDNLWLLSSGSQPPNPSELLGSRRMSGLVRELRQHADVLVFDSPPTLLVSDALVLAPQLDGVLLVVQSAKTREGTAKRALQALLKVNANVLGVAINRVAPRAAGWQQDYVDYLEQASSSGQDQSGNRAKQHSARQERSAEALIRPAVSSGLMAGSLRQSGSPAQDT